jgi:regulator of replication initiation timing
MAIIVPILTTFNDKGIKSAVREFQTATTKIQKFGAVGKIFGEVGQSLTKNLTLPILGVGAAFGVMIKGAIEAEAAQQRLRIILNNTGLASSKQIDALLEQASALEKVGVASKESIVTAQSQLATFDLQASTIATLTPAILDYVIAEKGATATTEDFKTMTNSLGAALQGQFGALTRANFRLTENQKKMVSTGTESERATAIVELLTSTYGGFNEALAKTPQGQMIILSREFGQIRDEIGGALLPVFLKLVGILREQIIPRIQDFVALFKALSPATLETVAKIAGFLAILGPLLIVIGYVSRAVVILTKTIQFLQLTILRIPLAIALIIGLFAAQNDAQFKLAKSTNDSWGQISRVIVLGIKGIVGAIDLAIDGFNFLVLSIKYAKNQYDNFINFINGKPTKSLMSFDDLVRGMKFSNLAGGVENLVTNFSDMSSEIKKTAEESKIMASEANRLAMESELLAKDLDKSTVATEKNTKALKKMKDAAKNAAEIIVNNLEESLRKAESGLDDVKGKFESFRDAITGTITGILNFGKAAESENFLQGLADQAQNATDFANKVKQLVVLGLNERGIRQVLDAGFEAGGQIADEIIAGGATVVQQVNTLVDSIFGVAEQVGEFGAVAFYDAGVKQAEAMVAGIKAALESARADLKLIVDGLTTGNTTTGAGPSATDPAPSAEKLKQDNIRKPILTNKQIATISKLPDAATRHYTALATALNNKTIKLAKGGIVTGPTNALIGEAGPEAVIPLSGANSMSMGSNYYITVNAGIGTSGSQVGREIVDAIKKFEKTSGPVFASA